MPDRRVCLLTCWTAAGCGFLSEPAPRSPDVLVVVLDTVRADAVGVYGAARSGVTPQVDALAAQGVRFDDTTAPGSWTWPSHTSLFTGRPPWEHGARLADPADAPLILGSRKWAVGAFPDDLTTLAEHFSAAGYRTVSLSENPLVGPKLGSTRGFATAETRPEGTGLGWVVDRARTVIADDDPRPLMLFVNILDAHHPWLVAPVSWLAPHAATLDPATAPDWLRSSLVVDDSGVTVDLLGDVVPGGPTAEVAFHTGTWTPPPGSAQLFRDLYDASVQRADFKLHQIVTAWSTAGRSGAVAVTSDHGELLGERQMLFHGRTVWPELTRVPLVVVAPGRIPPGAVVSAPVMMTDLHDTLLDLADLPVDHPRSLLPAARTEGPVPPGPIQAAAWPDVGFGALVGGDLTQGWRQYRDHGLALIASEDGSVRRLYDLAADPGMLHDLAASRPDDLARVAAAASTAFPTRRVSRAANVDPELVDHLEALGYLEREPVPEPAPPTP